MKKTTKKHQRFLEQTIIHLSGTMLNISKDTKRLNALGNKKYISKRKQRQVIVEGANPKFISNLSQRYKFDNFIMGEGNKLASTTAKNISENPFLNSYNPLIIYGLVGLGKTHIIQAFGNEVLKNDSSKKIVYLTTEQFTVEFIDAIQNGTASGFSSFYKSVDVLIFDDVQFLTGKPRTQDYFLHIFDHLYQTNKMIVLSSDNPPHKLEGISERLISRFQSGLTVKINAPDFETRVGILKNRADSYMVQIPDEVLEYIANNITSSIRELEGCLTSLLVSAALDLKGISLDLAKAVVNEITTPLDTDQNIIP